MTLLDELLVFTDEHRQSIPVHMHEGLINYIENHKPSGDFLMSIFRNDLSGAVQRADPMNSRNIRAYIFFLMQYAPHECWGNPEKVAAWIKKEDK